MKIAKEKVLEVTETGLSKVTASLEVSTIAEIPDVNDIEGRILCQGTVCHAIKEGVLAKLDEDGSWHDISGNLVKGVTSNE